MAPRLPIDGEAAADRSAAAVQAIVAPRRTVQHEGRLYGPGEPLLLPESEVGRLRARGFLVDPSAPEVPVGNGPTFSPSAGPLITAAR